MRRFTVLVIPDGNRSTKQFYVPRAALQFAFVASFLLVGFAGFLAVDYLELRQMRAAYYEISAENEGLKGEARVLMTNLDEVKKSLQRLEDYSHKLGELTELRVEKVTQKTGIGPLSEDEFRQARTQQASSIRPTSAIPLGINIDNLIFRPVFDRLREISGKSQNSALELQRLLSTLSQQRSLLSSVPSVAPVSGWITSGFGYRTSPFTGQRTMHMGIDMAAPIGTPIYAPADGVVIFSGAKGGYGNFVMIAHGYGIVTRYGHNAQNMVQAGQKINRGEQIATVGMTGRTTGPHLHYEVMLNGRAVDPKRFVLNISDDRAH